MQAFIIPVTGCLLKRFGWCVDQAIGQFTRQILHDFLRIAALLQRSQRFRRQLLPDLERYSRIVSLALWARSQAINSLVSCSTIVSACTAAALRCARLC